MHALHVYLELLRLTELLPAHVADWPGPPGVGRAAVGAVHLQIILTEEILRREYTHGQSGNVKN